MASEGTAWTAQSSQACHQQMSLLASSDSRQGMLVGLTRSADHSVLHSNPLLRMHSFLLSLNCLIRHALAMSACARLIKADGRRTRGYKYRFVWRQIFCSRRLLSTAQGDSRCLAVALPREQRATDAVACLAAGHTSLDRGACRLTIWRRVLHSRRLQRRGVHASPGKTQ